MTEAMLFDGFPDPPPLETTGAKKPRAKVKEIHARRIAAGINPITGLKLADNGEYCGTCVHRVLIREHNKTFPKCDETPMSRSETSDCRAHYPACTSWAPKAGRSTIDAAASED